VKFVYENIRRGLANFIKFAFQNAPKLRANHVKTVGGWGFAPDTTGELTTLPQTPNRLGRGLGQAPSPTSPPRRLRASILAPSALGGLALPNFRSWRRHWNVRSCNVLSVRRCLVGRPVMLLTYFVDDFHVTHVHVRARYRH